MDFWLGLACTHSSPWIIQVLETYSESLGGSRRNETTRDLNGVARVDTLEGKQEENGFAASGLRDAGCFEIGAVLRRPVDHRPAAGGGCWHTRAAGHAW